VLEEAKERPAVQRLKISYSGLSTINKEIQRAVPYKINLRMTELLLAYRKLNTKEKRACYRLWEPLKEFQSLLWSKTN